MTSSPTENDAEKKNKEQVRCTKFDFSIEHILNRAGNSRNEEETLKNLHPMSMVGFPWLHCTRYCPPRIPRNQRKEGPQKRQLGRHPRIPFTSQQLAVLEEKFRETPYLSSAEVTKISRRLQLADVRVKIWFQNRRARERRERTQYETEQNICTYISSTLPATSIDLPNSAKIKSEDSESDCKNSISPVTQISVPSTTTDCLTFSNVNTPFFLEYTKSCTTQNKFS